MPGLKGRAFRAQKAARVGCVWSRALIPWRFRVNALIHRAVLWYIERRGGVLHTLPYLAPRRYIVSMGEVDYCRWVSMRTPPPGHRRHLQWKSH